jgi:Na+/proline symporter/two-component sensor histidine kinase
VLPTWIVVLVAAGYLGLLFAVAFFGDRRADRGKSVINSGTIYALSLAVYATTWTYFGSVGLATTDGVGFLPVYIGPTIMFALAWMVLRKIIRISRRNRLTSLADFASARYGKSPTLGALVTIMAVVGIVPYISLQLEAVSNSFEIIRHPESTTTFDLGNVPPLQDTALYIALLMAGFGILFGTRHLDATERHEGMVAAIALESVIKIVAFLTAGVFVTFGLFNGFGDLFGRAADADLSAVFTLGSQGGYGPWTYLLVLSMLAIVLLPRQWQVGVVENIDERHLKRAMWLFPLYLLVINLFVLPIAAGGLLRFGDTVDPDTLVLALPMSAGKDAVTLLVFIGGVSAATGMIIVETIALSTMVSNSLIMPLLLRGGSRLAQRDPARLVLRIRRLAIVFVLLLGYTYFHFTGQKLALVSTGLMSFVAVAQFAPAILGGLFWKDGTRKGALVGLAAGMIVWSYTLLVPSFHGVGLITTSFLNEGPFGLAALRPTALFGLSGMDSIGHALFWSALANIGGYVGVSLLSRPDPDEHARAVRFLEGDDGVASAKAPTWQGRVSVGELRALLQRFLGGTGMRKTLDRYPRKVDLEKLPRTTVADPDLVHDVETLLAGSVGAASAHLVMGSVAGQSQLRPAAVIEMIDEASHVAAREERYRLARELHDSVSQALFSMTLHTRAMELAARQEGLAKQSPVIRSLAQMHHLTQDALNEMRALILHLRPDALRNDGLAAAVRRHATGVASLHGQKINVHAPERRLPLDEFAEEELFRVIQEALHNIVKHASARNIDIGLYPSSEPEKSLLVDIADDGVGFDPTEAYNGHMGLSGMRERVERLGGQLNVDSRAGSTTVHAFLPGILGFMNLEGSEKPDD